MTNDEVRSELQAKLAWAKGRTDVWMTHEGTGGDAEANYHYFVGVERGLKIAIDLLS